MSADPTPPQAPRHAKTLYPGPPTNPPPAHLPADMRDMRSLRDDLLDVRDTLSAKIDANAAASLARDAKTSERLDAIERIARATFEELTGRDAASIPGIRRDWGRVLRLSFALVVVVVLSAVTACATARAVLPAPPPSSSAAP